MRCIDSKVATTTGHAAPLALRYRLMAYDLVVMGSIPVTIEVSTLRYSACTNCPSLQLGVEVGTWSIVMSALCGCYTLICIMTKGIL